MEAEKHSWKQYNLTALLGLAVPFTVGLVGRKIAVVCRCSQELREFMYHPAS